MKAILKANAEIDFLTRDELHEEIEHLRETMLRLSNVRPLVRTVEGSVSLDAAGAGVIRVDMPVLARAWDVRRINVTYENPAAASVATVVTVFRGNVANPLNYVDRNLVGPPAGNVPCMLPYTSRVFTLRQDEQLLLSVTGGTPATPIFGSAQVIGADFDTIYARDLS